MAKKIFYIKHYVAAWDEIAQSPVDEETAEKARQAGKVEVSESPFPDIPIRSRYISERHITDVEDMTIDGHGAKRGATSSD